MKRSPLLPIFLIVLVDILGLTIILPLLPFYAESLGASATVVGALVSAYALCSLVAGPILGKWSDSIGRKPLLILSQLGTFAGFIILANAHVLWVVFLSRIIDGFTAGNLSLAQAYITDVTEPQNRAKSFALIGIAFGVGFMIGPSASGFLSKHYGVAPAIYAAAGLSALSVLCTTFLLPRVTPGGHSDAGPAGRKLAMLDWKAYSVYFSRPILGPLLLQFFLFTLSFSWFMSGFALFAERRYGAGPGEVGYIYGYAGLLGIILQGGLVGRLVKIFGERQLAWTGFAVSSTSAVWMGFTRTIPQVFANCTYGSYGNGVTRPVLTSLITRNAGKREQGVVLGLTSSLMSVAQIIAPIAAGAVIERQFLTSWALVGAAIAALGFVFAFRDRTEPADAQQPTSSAA